MINTRSAQQKINGIVTTVYQDRCKAFKADFVI